MTDQLLRNLNIKRGHIKASVTRFKTFLTTAMPSEIYQVESRLQKFESLWTDFQTVQSSIEELSLTETEQPNAQHIQERESFEESYYQVSSDARKFIAENSPAVSNITMTSRSTPTPSDTDAYESNIKLPTINLPSFSGSYGNWVEFYDAFDALINKNNKLSDVQKFYYLRSCLKNGAEQVIQSIEISAANYSIAWDLLRERYENKRLLVNSYVNDLFNMQVISKESALKLRNIHDTVTKSLRALKHLEQPTETWDTLVIHIIVSKFDNTTRKEWESYKIKGELPTIGEMKSFLKTKCELLETLESNSSTNKPVQGKFTKQTNQISSHLVVAKGLCPYCKNAHQLYRCETFRKLPTSSKIGEVKKMKLCMNCLRDNHFSKDCHASLCKLCNKQHNTLLHLENETNVANKTATNTDTANQINNQTTISNISLNHCATQVLLATACVQIRDSRGRIHTCRALLDNGSQSNFISEELCNRLQLTKTKINYSIAGINHTLSNTKHKTQVTIHSVHNSYKAKLTCLVLPKITSNLPGTTFDPKLLDIPKNIKLADPTFHKESGIDILIGASLFYELLCIGQKSLGKYKPVLQKTLLGWIISGSMPLTAYSTQGQTIANFCTTDCNEHLHSQISKFWEIEEVTTKQVRTKEEQACEDYFLQNVTREPNGRFNVKIPLRSGDWTSNGSRKIALKRLYSIERKLNNDKNLKRDYNEFMEEYKSLGHMTKISEDETNSKLIMYLPHHPVIRETSLTTKLRVVFDGSSKDETGLSSNDIQMVGPTIQNDLVSILMRFRKHSVVITADIAKMYRQILIHESQRDLQRILWRTSSQDTVECYQLNTVTYGTASAPFLAIRCLHQLAIDNKETYPEASDVIENDFYVDDMLTGTDSTEKALKLASEISDILNSAKFELRKWASNDKLVLGGIAPSQSAHASKLTVCDKSGTKTLGICWNPENDILHYDLQLPNQHQKITKRNILSTISQVYDPLGLLGPVTITAKLIVQNLWRTQTAWDETVQGQLYTDWKNFKDQLPFINQIKITRHVLCKKPIRSELHGFCDASEVAYGACVYVKTEDDHGRVTINLLCAKSRVAPLKQITLPRLELCGAVLLAKIIQKINDAMKINFSSLTCWSDSTITLSWIAAEPTKWKTFVANRVAEIQRLTDKHIWKHVRSEQNPADLISRGVSAQELIKSTLWWNGPSWLSADCSDWQSEKFVPSTDAPEAKGIITTNIAVTQDKLDIFTLFSSLERLKRFVALCLRFRSNHLKPKNERNSGNLTVPELQSALLRLIKIAQHESYSQEIENLSKQKSISNKSSVLSLNPFLDEHKIMRVGGRLHNSNFTYNKKHPIILPPKHPLTKLVMESEHKRLLHCGPQTMLASVRERFWPVAGKNLAKQVVHKCVICFKARPTGVPYLMGNLPPVRVTPAPPFFNCGIDYAGPFVLKDRKTRGAKQVKGYICLFICLATKAVHLEAVSELTTDAFIATLKRFIARRGKPQNIHSDNGTNFVGAKEKLNNDLTKFLHSNQKQYVNFLNTENISWHFIPPRAPHFGGLWEAGVKSTKSHLKRVIGDKSLTYEEFITILAQIESILNSRPLCPLSNDPNDLDPLTPSHFLIGRPTTSLPEPDVQDINENRLTRFQIVQRIVQHYWVRWHKEYVSELQNRVKWKQNQPNLLKVGAMIIIRDDNLPPTRWQLGRITELHPGNDGIVRVVTVRCKTSVLKRPVSKICVLPIESEHKNL